MVRKALMLLLGLAGLWIVLHLALHRPVERPYLIAHRGAAELAPENTIASLRAGIQSGAEQIEIDVQRTADGVLILFHDARLDTKRIRDYRWEELAEKRVGGEPIPTLDEALGVFAAEAGEGAILAIEGKDSANYPGIAGEIVAAVEAHDLGGRVRIVSFDPSWLREVHGLAPEMELGRIYVYPLIVPREEGVETISLNWIAAMLDPTVVSRIHAKGYDVVVWTTDSPAVMRLMAWLGVDGISTNRPDLRMGDVMD